MRSLPGLLLALSFLVSGTALAQGDMEIVPCEQCRDPIDHPEDYVNHAFNQIYGPDAWMDFDQADDFFIRGPDGQLVYVDVDFVFFGIGIEGLRLPFWPKYQLMITIALPNGELRSFVRSIYLTPLPVPADIVDPMTEPGDGDAPADGDGGEGDDAGSEWDTAEDEPEDPDWDDGGGNVGITGIQDPDDDGNFPDPDWCQEC